MMKKVSRNPWMVGMILLSFALLSACAAPSKTQPKQGHKASAGIYKNDQYGFSVQYPSHYKPQPLINDEVFRAANPNEWLVPVITANVGDPESGMKLESAAFIASAKRDNAGSKRFKVLSEKGVTLNDGTPGLALTYKWTWTDGMTKLQTATLWAIKGGKSISANATTVLGGDTTPEKLMAMVSTLKFY